MVLSSLDLEVNEQRWTGSWVNRLNVLAPPLPSALPIFFFFFFFAFGTRCGIKF